MTGVLHLWDAQATTLATQRMQCALPGYGDPVVVVDTPGLNESPTADTLHMVGRTHTGDPL